VLWGKEPCIFIRAGNPVMHPEGGEPINTVISKQTFAQRKKMCEPLNLFDGNCYLINGGDMFIEKPFKRHQGKSEPNKKA